MYDEKGLNHKYVYSVWQADLNNRDTRYTESANKRWGFVFREQSNNQVFAHVIGPSAQHYDFTGESHASMRYWGVELHEFVEMPGINKSNLQGAVRKIGQSKTKMHIGGREIPIPSYQELPEFIATLLRGGLLTANNYYEELSRGLISLSERSLQRITRRTTGLSRKQIEQIERVESAVAMLEASVPIAAAAARLGFFDQSHLTKTIKRVTGRTPSLFTAPK